MSIFEDLINLHVRVFSHPDAIEHLAGQRIRLLAMPCDPDPLPIGLEGTVRFAHFFDNRLHVTVDWDERRGLSLVCPPDRFMVLPDPAPAPTLVADPSVPPLHARWD